MTMEQFLNKLPQNIVKEGRVIPIRDAVGDTFEGGPKTTNQVTLVETASVRQLKERLAIDENERPISARDLTTLRIKSEKGDHTYILKMKFKDSIGDVRAYLNRQR